jgi:hypothetical protein
MVGCSCRLSWRCESVEPGLTGSCEVLPRDAGEAWPASSCRALLRAEAGLRSSGTVGEGSRLGLLVVDATSDAAATAEVGDDPWCRDRRP